MTVLGFIFAEGYIGRCRFLKVWLFILDILKTEIYYHTQMLPDIFEKITTLISDSTLIKAFHELAESVTIGSELDISRAWENFLNKSTFNKIHPHDLSVLQELGTFIGSTDRQDQMQRIESCRERLKLNLEQAEIARNKHVGIYRYLGFALGVMVVLWIV